MMKTARTLGTLTGMAGGAALLLGLAGEASAQFFPRPFLYGGYYSGPVVVPVPRGPIGLGIAEIFEDLRDRGYRPLGVASRREDVVVIDAIGPRNQPVRLIVDAYDGEILERFARQGDPARTLPGGALEPRKRDHARPPGNTEARETDTRLAEVPVPPRRATGQPAPGTRPAPVAPARDPSLWAPAPGTPTE